VRVHHDEDLASHIGPEPCADVCEEVGEASVGECTGQPLSRERKVSSGCRRRGNCGRLHSRRVSASALLTARGRRTWTVRTLLVWEPGDLQLDRLGHDRAVRIGKARSRSR
jgi:hypothetical protein